MMYTLKDVEVKPWVAAQILNFLNQADNAQVIVDGIQDDPNSGNDNAGIGTTVAQRIIDKRESLQFKRFRSLEELEDVQGLGSDKVKDMIFSLGVPAHQFFRTILYNGILFENWVLNEDTVEFEDEASFRAIADNAANFKNFVIERKYGANNFSQSPEMVALRSSFVENYDISDYGSPSEEIKKEQGIIVNENSTELWSLESNILKKYSYQRGKLRNQDIYSLDDSGHELFSVRGSSEVNYIGLYHSKKNQIRLLNRMGQMHSEFPLAGQTKFDLIDIPGSSDKMLIVANEENLIAYRISAFTAIDSNQ